MRFGGVSSAGGGDFGSPIDAAGVERHDAGVRGGAGDASDGEADGVERSGESEEKGNGDTYGVVGEEDDGGGEGLATDAPDDGRGDAAHGVKEDVDGERNHELR